MRVAIYTQIIILFVCCSDNKEPESRSVFVSEIGWPFRLPIHLRFIDSAFNSSGIITWDTIFTTRSSRLFKIKEDYFNTFTAVLQADTDNYDNWRSSLDSQILSF